MKTPTRSQILCCVLSLIGMAPAQAAESSVAGDRLAEVVSAVSPVYPYLMRRVDGTAEVTVSFIVNSKGLVTKASIFKSDNPEFNAATLAAIKKWTFTPATKNGQVVDAKVRQTFRFSLEDKKAIAVPLLASEKNPR